MSAPGNVKLTPEVMYGASGQSVYLEPVIDGVKVTPTGSPTVRIRRPGGALTAITAGVCTVDGSGIVRYALDASSTTDWPLFSGYWAEFQMVVGSETLTVRTTFDVVLQPLQRACPIHADDIKGADPRISSYLTSNSRMTADLPSYILRAWEDVYLWIRSRAEPRPYLISDARVLYSVTRYRALYWVALAISEDNPHFEKVATAFAEEFDRAKALTVLEYAPENTLALAQQRALQQPQLLTGPDRRDSGGTIDDNFWRRSAGLP